jgi:hypothetical protein
VYVRSGELPKNVGGLSAALNLGDEINCARPARLMPMKKQNLIRDAFIERFRGQPSF